MFFCEPVLTFKIVDVEFTSLPGTGDPPEPLKLSATECIKSLMSCSVLNKSGFVTEPIVAIFSHAMKMSLVLTIVAT